MKIRTISLLLAGIFLIGSFSAVNIIPANAITTDNTDDKIYCNATIDDDFAPDGLLVVLNNRASLECKTYSKTDFNEVKAKKVDHITTYTESRVRKVLKNIETAATSRSTSVTVENIDLSTYNQVLYIELQDAGKDKVLDAIKALEKRDEVLY